MELFREGEEEEDAVSHVGGNVGVLASNRRFGNYCEEVSHFPAKRIFYATASTADSGDDHSFSFSTHATEWAWNYGRAGGGRARPLLLPS